jgi:alkaline phosphatase D
MHSIPSHAIMKHSLLIFILVVMHGSILSQVYPENIFPDTDHAPFIHGVTSGDPTSSSVIIWTRIESEQAESVFWELSLSPEFNIVVQSGTFSTGSYRDWTVKVDVTNLLPATTYYYRFKSASNQFSDVGRTRTAPVGHVYQSRLAVMSCSSIYSGFFNAYKRIAEREDLDLIVHVGDYIYDFVDEDEEVRVPMPYPFDPITLDQWRDRHRYYLLDPDLRAARKTHPWIALWDNHDIDWADGEETAPIQAFLEYLPIRLPDPSDSSRIYRKLSYGDLIDIFVTDVLMYKGLETVDGTNPSMIGNTQFTWLSNELSASTAKWKLLPMQNLMAGWSVQNVPSFVGIGSDGVLDPSNWDGYDTDRDRVLNHIKNNNIDNVVVLSGDSHVTIVADLSTNPQNTSVYNRNTGEGSIAVEFLPTSISRGNFDEMGFGWALGIVTPVMANENPNHVRANYIDHGYGLLDIKSDSCVAEIWYSDKMNMTNTETFDGGFVVKDKQNRWNRTATTVPTTPKDWQNLKITELEKAKFQVFPNPASVQININGQNMPQYGQYALLNASGKYLSNLNIQSLTSHQVVLNLPHLPKGAYFIKFEHEGIVNMVSFIKE